MNKATELKTTKALVKTILEQYPKARNSDSFLYLKLLGVIADKEGMDMGRIPVTTFLLNMSAWKFPPFESVRRARQKLQREFPELSASKEVQECRDDNIPVYEAFARGELSG